MSEEFQTTSIPAEHALYRLNTLFKFPRTPGDVWQFIDFESESLGINGAQQPEFLPWYWGKDVSISGGNGTWEHMAKNTQLADKLIVASSPNSRQIGVIGVEEAYAGFISELLRIPADQGSNISINSSEKQWALSVTDNQGKLLYSTGEDYQTLANVLSSLGFMSHRSWDHSDFYQNFLFKLRQYIGCGLKFIPKSDQDQPSSTADENNQNLKAIVNTRSNPQASRLTEAELREHLGGNLPWGSIDQVIAFTDALPTIAKEKSTEGKEIWLEGREISVKFTTNQGDRSLIVRDTDLVGQIISYLDNPKGLRWLNFKKFEINLTWCKQGNSRVTVLTQRYLRSTKNGTKYEHFWKVEPGLYETALISPIRVEVDDEGTVLLQHGRNLHGSFHLNPTEERGYVTKEQMTEIFLHNLNTFEIMDTRLHQDIFIKKSNLDKPTISEIEEKLAGFERSGTITREQHIRITSLIQLWSTPWDRHSKAHARRLYSKQKIKDARSRNKEFRTHHGRHDPGLMPWQSTPQELVIRGLIGEELGPWLYDNTGIHFMELLESNSPLLES